jgi:hypothetical protein
MYLSKNVMVADDPSTKAIVFRVAKFPQSTYKGKDLKWFKKN